MLALPLSLDGRNVASAPVVNSSFHRPESLLPPPPRHPAKGAGVGLRSASSVIRSTVALRRVLSVVLAPETSMLAILWAVVWSSERGCASVVAGVHLDAAGAAAYSSACNGVFGSAAPASASAAHCASCAALNASHDSSSRVFKLATSTVAVAVGSTALRSTARRPGTGTGILAEHLPSCMMPGTGTGPRQVGTTSSKDSIPAFSISWEVPGGPSSSRRLDLALAGPRPL